MSFRRKDIRSDWKKWKRLHRAQLDRIGVLDSILDDERRWLIFLQEGGWDADSGFKLDMLSASQLEQLEKLLRRKYGDDLTSPAHSCLMVLRKMAADRRRG